METHVKVTRHGQVTIPKKIRNEYNIQVGDYVELSSTDDGIVLRPKKAVYVDPDQAWYWTKEWQKRELEADEDIARGDGYEVSPDDDPVEALHRLAKSSD